MTDWIFDHSVEVCVLAVLGALTAAYPYAAPALVTAAGWWVWSEWRVARVAGRERERA